MAAMRRAAVAGLAVLALFGALLLWQGTSHDRTRAAHASDRADAATGKAPTSNAASSGAGGDAPVTVHIKGTVSEGPCPLSLQDGTLRFRIDGADEVEAPIHEGEWEAAAPKGATLTIEEILFGDRKAVAVPATVEVPDDGKVCIECRWAVPTLLRVIGEKGEDLREVEYYETDDYDDWGPGWPEATAATSPIEFAGAEGIHAYLVRAPGHAWSRITVFVGFGGERVVRLARAGTLDVRLSPFDPEAGITVRVNTDGYWIPDETGRVSIDSVRPGDHEIFAQVGPRFEVVGEANASVEAGRTTELTVAIGELPVEPELVPLAGTIEVARGWTEEDEATPSCMTPSIEGWDAVCFVDVEMEEDGRWSTEVRPGRCCFRLDAWTWVQAVDVGSHGATDVRLVVPAPCEVEVHLVDGATGNPIPWEENIQWFAKAPGVEPELQIPALPRFQFCEEPGVYRFRAPVGTLVVGLWSELLSAESCEVDLKPGLNRVELKAEWTLGVDLDFRDGRMPVPADAGFRERIEATALEGEGVLEECGTRDPCRVWVTKPGRYRVTFGVAIEGYEPIAPVEVEVAPGRIPRVEIALRRRDR
jgi:hypothetical protein